MTPPPSRLGVFGALWFCYFAAIGSFNPFAPLWFKELGFSTLAIAAASAAAVFFVAALPPEAAVPAGVNAIDYFVRERLKKDGLAPSA